jgi:hypothetical protein
MSFLACLDLGHDDCYLELPSVYNLAVVFIYGPLHRVSVSESHSEDTI